MVSPNLSFPRYSTRETTLICLWCALWNNASLSSYWYLFLYICIIQLMLFYFACTRVEHWVYCFQCSITRSLIVCWRKGVSGSGVYSQRFRNPFCTDASQNFLPVVWKIHEGNFSEMVSVRPLPAIWGQPVYATESSNSVSQY